MSSDCLKESIEKLFLEHQEGYMSMGFLCRTISAMCDQMLDNEASCDTDNTVISMEKAMDIYEMCKEKKT